MEEPLICIRCCFHGSEGSTEGVRYRKIHLSQWLGNRLTPKNETADWSEQAHGGVDCMRACSAAFCAQRCLAQLQKPAPSGSLCVGFREPGTFCGSRQHECFPKALLSYFTEGD